MERIGHFDRTNEGSPMETGDWSPDSVAGPRSARRWNGANAPGKRSAGAREPAAPAGTPVDRDGPATKVLDHPPLCPLEIRFPYGVLFATGWLAGPTTVVTAGHAVFDPRLGGWAEAAVAYPAGGGQGIPPYRTVAAQALDAAEDWLQRQEPRSNIGVLHLAGPLGPGHERFLQPAMPADEDLQGREVEICGYAMQTDRNRDMNDRPLARLKARAERIDPQTLMYQAWVPAGLCGAPVLLRQPGGGRAAVVAVHAGGGGAGGGGGSAVPHAAARITSDSLQAIERWRRGPGPQSRLMTSAVI